MQLILAIDGDTRRSEQLASVVRARLTVELVQAAGAGEGLQALKDRIPDLILTAPLLSPFDDGVLDEYLRELGAAGAHVQTLRIPVLSAGPRKKALAAKLFSMSKKSKAPAAPDGCEPKVFADEIAAYLSRAADARRSVAHLLEAQPRQDAPPPSPVVRDTLVMHEAIVEEFTYAYTSAADDTPAPVDIEATEPSYVQVEPSHDMATEPSDVEAAETSSVDDAWNTAAPVVETKFEADRLTAPEPERQAPSTSASFEAALAAIRAAWVKPGESATATSSVLSATPRAGSPGEVDLTNAVESLEHVGDRPSTPPARRQVDKAKARPEKVPGAKMGVSAGRSQDVWGLYDSSRRDSSTPVDTLDEVTAPKETPQRPGGILFR